MKGTRFGRTKKDAEKLTTEIDRAAELVAAEQAMGAASGAADLAERSMQSAIGGRTLDVAGEAERGEALNAAEAVALSGARGEGFGRQEDTGREREALASDARIKELVAAENGYARSELEAGANVVGAESKKEVRERLRDDRDDLKMEEGVGWEHDLLTKGQERLTNEAMKQIDAAVKQGAMQPAKLEKLRFLGMNAILATYGRKFGERN